MRWMYDWLELEFGPGRFSPLLSRPFSYLGLAMEESWNTAGEEFLSTTLALR